MDIDWDELRRVADEAQRKAYAPYSHYRVGAAALVDDGRIVSGCNVENASYGVTLCAECAMVGDLFMSGGGTADRVPLRERRGRDDHAVRPVPAAALRALRTGHAAGDRLRHQDDR